MLQMVNITQARNNLSRLIDQVTEKNDRIILIRESVPQAVLISYEQYQKQEENWEIEFEKVRKKLRKRFKQYLKEKKIPYPKTEEEVYDIVDKITCRHRH